MFPYHLQRTKASYLSHGTSTVAVRLDLVLLRNSFEKIGLCLHLYLTLERLRSFKSV